MDARKWFAAAALLLGLFAGGCRQQSQAPANSPGNAEATRPAGQESIQVKGSDTMVNLGQAWAEAYMKQHPDTSVAVTGGGSGTGIAALINGTTDVAESSRAMKPEEIEQARSRRIEIAEHKVALDAVTVIVHPSSPAKRLTVPQLAGIYTGKITNWKEAGGPDRKIVPLSRDKNSGTHVFFLEHVVRQGNAKGTEQFAPSILMLSSSQAIAQEVAQNQDAIGYVGLGYVRAGQHQAVAVAPKAGAEFVTPTRETVTSGKYPVARPLYIYTTKSPSATVQAFVEFARSPRGQEIVATQEFVPLPAAGAARPGGAQ